MNQDDGYIVFEDPEVERICVSNWGDGVGLTKAAAASITDLNEIFEQNSTIRTFNEFKYFKNINTRNNGGAFYNCTSLEEITWPTDSVPNSCFEGCSSLRDIYFTVPIYSSVWSFTNCPSLVNIHFNSLNDLCNSSFLREDYHPFWTSKNGHVFVGNTEITSLNLVPLIYNRSLTFYCCKSITSLNLDNATTIGYGAFYDCTGLTTIPDFSHVTRIDRYAFENCTNLEGDIFIPSTCQVFTNAFYNCRKIHNFVMNGENGDYSKRANSAVMQNVGDGTGLFYSSSDFNTSNDDPCEWNYNKAIINGVLYRDNTSEAKKTIEMSDSNSANLEAIYVEGIYQNNGDGSVEVIDDCHLKFISIANSIMTNCPILRIQNSYPSVIVHLGSSSVAVSPNLLTSANINDKIDMIYVGNGSSPESDQLILDRYMSNPDWAQYANKLDIWSNYNGVYKTRPTIPTQSNNS